MNFSVYLCICIIFSYYGSQTAASQSHANSEQFFKLLTEYIRNSGGYKVGALQTGDARALPLPLLILPVPEGSVNTQDQNVDIQNEDQLDFQSRLGFQQRQQNAPKGFSINKQLHKQFTVQGTEDDGYSSNFGKNSGGSHRTIIVKEPSITTNSRLSDVQQATGDDEYSSNNFENNPGALHRTIIVKQSSKTTNPRLPVQPETPYDEFSNNNFESNSGAPHRTIIVKQSSKPTNPRVPVQPETPYDEFSNNNFESNSGAPHRTIIVKQSSKPTNSRVPVQPETPYDEFSNNNFESNSGAPHRTIIVKQPSKPTNSRVPVQPETPYDEVPSNKPVAPHRTFIVKQPSITTNSRLPDLQQETPYDEYPSNNFESTPRPLHRTIIVKEPPKTNSRFPEMSLEASSKDLLRQFHAQYAHLQEVNLPPAVIDKAAFEDNSQFAGVQENYNFQEQGEVGVNQGKIYLPNRSSIPNSPPTPQWNFPLKMKAELLIPRAEYTEPYQMWFNSKTGACKTDFHEGGTITYRMPTTDGRQKKVAKRTNRLGESNIAECIVASTQDADFSAPGLPDLTNYQFGGYENSGQGNFEKWVYQLRGNPGQHGASAQESLTFNHEMLVQRGAKNVIPVAYTVKIDSTVLGANCDGYSHRYLEVEDLHEDDQTQFDFDIDANCQRQETGDVNNPDHRIHLEPLYEFSLPGRDDRYDVEIETFKTQYQRTYMDHTEEAMRKNLFIQHSRFVLSGNRESATFELEMNFLGDRLEAELSLLRGVSWEGADNIPGAFDVEDFPHPEPEVKHLSRKLPKQFDWRPLGAVSAVHWQGSCPSCWAFAVAGAVEGALFVRKRRLVPLSEQCLVDCSRPFGTNGCGGSWPQAAYNYVKARGLPAREEYGPYIEKEESCHRKPASEPVTHISAYVNVTQRSVPALQIAIRRHSPSVVIIDAHPYSFIHYKTGVLHDDRCGKTREQSNHAVLAVGWGEHRNTPYFILKNSWSANWGEQGYIRVQGPANTCGVLTQPSYPRLEDNDVDRLPN